jgi:PTH1 family peptidyl-tRNA hydrolase
MTATRATIVIIGLGNPGKKYEYTRHNAGYRVVDRVRTGLGLAAFRRDESLLSEITEETFGTKRIVIARSLTFMNDSGLAVERLAKKYRVESENILVIHDDKDLPLGTIRVKKAGGSAGHKGVDSIAKQLGSVEFVRYRLGIWSEIGKTLGTDKFVLAKFLPEEEPAVRLLIDRASQQVIQDLGLKASQR